MYVLMATWQKKKKVPKTVSGANKEAGVRFKIKHLDGIMRAWQIGRDTGYS